MNLIADFWNGFLKQNRDHKHYKQPPSYYFCDNKKDADECAELVLKGIKQASSPSVWWFQKNNEEVPEVGNLAIVTNWNGEPKAIIQTIKIEIVKFKDITPEYAFIEGEGDKSLAYWKTVHWEYYANEMKEDGESPNQEMEIVCEYFKTVWSGQHLDKKTKDTEI
ncbi:ASCH domain-containing protein [Parapedobacter tibetensis]|uniref:ASCH domain-containing protein n=1 Tax=Parapedobacter tibetensis TaxID=2972951 RepID=UPI00214D96A0|nr:ASCH domain-containing protein [Parapedobacter tibetensis]